MSVRTELVQTGDPLFADTINELQNNLNEKIGLNAYHYINSGYSTSSTSYVNVDAVNMSVNLNTKGGDVLCLASSSLYTNYNGTAITFRWLVDNVQVTEMAFHGGVTSYRDASPIYWVARGLPAGSHLFSLQWKVNQAGGFTDWLNFTLVEL